MFQQEAFHGVFTFSDLLCFVDAPQSLVSEATKPCSSENNADFQFPHTAREIFCSGTTGVGIIAALVH